MNNNRLAQAFTEVCDICVFVDEYIVKDYYGQYRYVVKRNEIPLLYDKKKKSIEYRFNQYVMPYDTFVSIVDYMYEQGYLPFHVSAAYFTEKDIAHAQQDDDAAIEICNVAYLNKPNPDAYIVFNSIVKSNISVSVPTISFADMCGVL